MRVKKKQTYGFNKTELYETLINTSADCMLVADEDGLITFTTPQIKDLFGWESEEIIGRPVEILIPESLVDEHIVQRHSLKTNPHTRPMGTSLNIYAKRKNNTEFPVDIKLNFFKEKGKTFYLAVIRDITDRKKVEERYKILSNLTSDFAYSLGILPDGSFLREWVTDAFESITGYSENELDENEVLSSIVLSEDKYILDAHIEHVLRKENSTVEFRIKKKDGSIIYVEDYRYPVINEETGEVTHIYGAIKDITEKLKTLIEIKNNENKFRSLFENSIDGIVLLDKGSFIDCNKASADILNCSKNEIIGKTPLDFLPEFQPGNISSEEKMNNLTKNVMDGKPKHIVWLAKTFDGKLKYIDTSFNLVSFNSRNIIQCIFRDITKRKQKDKALQESENRLNLVLNATNDGVWDWNIKTGEVFYSRHWKESLGYSEEEVPSNVSFWEKVVHPNDLPQVQIALQKHFSGETKNYIIENRLLKKNGEYRWNLDRGKVVERDKNGKPLRMVGVDIDITSRKKSEKLLRQNEDILSSYYNSSPMMMGIVEVVGNDIIHISDNKSAKVFFGTKPGLGQNKFSAEIGVPGDIVELWLRHYKLSEQKGKAVKFEYPHQKGSKIVWLSVTVNFIERINESKARCSYIAEDISVKKEKEFELIKAKEKAEESNKVKAKFFANMSHELRTPLVGILGFSEIIRDEAKNEEFREYGVMIYSSALRLQRTLNSVLDFSKIDDKSFKYAIDEVNVNTLAKEEFNLFKVDTEKKQIDYKLNLDEDPFIIKSDKRALTTIFNQVIDNAVKYTKKGFVEVNVKKIQETDGTFLLFEVRDSGIGIEKEKLNLIWEEFRQVSEGLARNYEGVGLGLSIVKKFVGLLNGSIEVESDFQKGSSFCIKIPIKQVRKKVTKSDKIKELDKKRDDIMLIIIEDDPLNAIAIKKYLEKTYYVEHAATPKEAIKMCKNKNYYLVLMDINLKSNMNGIELMKFLKENNYSYKYIPFIAQTAYAVDKDKMKFMESGFSDFISKPYTKNELLEIVEKNLSLKN